MENTEAAPATEPTAPVSPPAPFQSRRALPSGGWVELRDPMQLRKRDKDQVTRGIEARSYGAAGVELVDGVILIAVLDWEIPYLPGAVAPHRNPKLLGELTIADGNALEDIVGEYRRILFPEMASIDQMGVLGSPTRPASA